LLMIKTFKLFGKAIAVYKPATPEPIMTTS